VKVREKVYTFGPDRGIVGILTEPDEAVARPNAPVVIASNVGLNHRVGPFRAYVDLARKLAAEGYPMLRFDLSGMGDSEPRRDNRSEFERSILDVKAAMTSLAEQRGSKTFVQLGFCSGVDSAHAVAAEDPSVVGAVFLEGYSYPTPRFYVRRWVNRLLTSRFWEAYARRRLARLFPQYGQLREVGEAVEIYVREYPTREELASDLGKMSGRGVHMLFVYCGEAEHAYNYADQFDDTFPELANDPHVEVEYLAKADHLYTLLDDRSELFERIARWMRTHFP
jgi:alpha-beta hydrolase superfamily lysophospholipase